MHDGAVDIGVAVGARGRRDPDSGDEEDQVFRGELGGVASAVDGGVRKGDSEGG